MRAFQQLTWRLAAQDIRAAGRKQLVSRVGLPALELLNRQRPLETLDIRFHPGRERRLVETMRIADRSRADIGITHPVHAAAPRLSGLIFLARDHLWI